MRHQGNKSNRSLITAARELREESTFAEAALWRELRGRGFAHVKFRRQHQIGDYIVDFYCRWLGVVIEIDGASHDIDRIRESDALRTRYLESLGLTVLRFDNQRVFRELGAVLDEIFRVVLRLQEKTPPAL